MCQHAAIADDVGMVTNTQCLAHVVIGDQNADATLLEETDDALDLDHRDRINPGKRFVQQDEAGLRRQSAGNLDASAFTAGEGQRRCLAQVLDAQVLQQSRQALLDLGLDQGLACLVALQLQHGTHILFHIEFAKNRGLLRQVTQPQARAAVDWHVGDRLAVDRDVTGTGLHQTDNHVKRCGLAGPVGTQQAHHFALAHRQRNVFDGLAATVELLQVADFQAAYAMAAISA